MGVKRRGGADEVLDHKRYELGETAPRRRECPVPARVTREPRAAEVPFRVFRGPTLLVRAVPARVTRQRRDAEVQRRRDTLNIEAGRLRL